jgi:tRNA uridine 5-carboxymethylaminomethyl modification enzyme
MNSHYDVIVVGGGHAGCEAAAISANMGAKTMLISMDLTKLAQMSCNPAIGGVGKGQIVREVDALGGYSGVVTDLTTIHFRMLNTSKGAAMWSPRAQCDRILFSIEWRKQLESIPNLALLQDEVIKLDIDESRVLKGLYTKAGYYFKCKTIVLTNGTFLNGLIHIGSTSFAGGRIGEPPSIGLSEQLKDLGFEVGRMKTGTPARIDGRTIDFSKLIEQKSDDKGKFSFLSDIKSNLPRRSCFIAHTNIAVHDELRKGFGDSPLFTGKIKGVGPRYCPSIEDKVNTFKEKNSHQLFLEPDGVSTYEMYLNGFSSSLPIDIQFNALKLIEGFENVTILRPGYAIEYDFFQPTQLKHTLESKLISNLFFAGQVNGTTGYEEAAGQGLIAGINATLKVNGKSEFTLKRDEGYIGVMIDDLVTKGVDEPYRVFTSRAEFRILIRQDNADERLTPMGEELGVVSKERYAKFLEKYSDVSSLQGVVEKMTLSPEDINKYLDSIGSSSIMQKRKLNDIILRPEISLKHLIDELVKIGKFLGNRPEEDIIQIVETRIKYGGYIEKEKLIANKFEKFESVILKHDFDYSKLESLSSEARQKLSKQRPRTIGEAQRISGISPTDINVLLVFLGR